MESLCNVCFGSLDRTYKDNMRFWYDLNPILDGCWLEEEVNTMAMQSVKLGLPGVQLELPLTMRKAFTQDANLLHKLAELIGDL